MLLDLWQVKMWDSVSGKCLHTLGHHSQQVTACAWLPDGRRFMTGSVDKCEAPSTIM